MAKFDPQRTAHELLSIQPATDHVGKVIGYYGQTSGLDAAGNPIEVFMPEAFVREHFTTAPKSIPGTPAAVQASAAKSGASSTPAPTTPSKPQS